MIYTNKASLPESVYNLLSKQRYSGGATTDYSVTTLLQPPRITQLKRRHEADLTEDVMDNVWSLFGHIAHSLLEEHGADNALSEERIAVRLLDREISGQVDSYHNGVITDYKVTSAWTIVYGSRLHEWTEQLNLYSYLFQQAGHEVKELKICTILRDWDKNKAKQDSSYPQAPIVIIPIPLWPFGVAEDFCLTRVQLHIDAEDKTDIELPLCSESEMWCQPTKFAVMKDGAKRATRVLDTYDEAWEYLNDLGHITDKGDIKNDAFFIDERKGKRTRCEDGYCNVSEFCSCYQTYLRSLE